MIKKILYSIFLTGILCLCALSVKLMYEADDKYIIEIDPSKVQMQDLSLEEKFEVTITDIPVTLETSCRVMPDDEYALNVYDFECKKNEFSTQIKVGQIIMPDDVIAIVKGKEIKASTKMKCLTISNEDESSHIKFLDYSKLYLEAQIPEKYLSYDLMSYTYNLKNDNTSLQAELSYLDYAVRDGNIIAKFSYNTNDTLLYPGTEFDISTELEVKKGVVGVLLSCVEVEGDRYYVNIASESGLIRHEVKIGTINNGMVEIVSGLSAGTKVTYVNGSQSLGAVLESSND